MRIIYICLGLCLFLCSCSSKTEKRNPENNSEESESNNDESSSEDENSSDNDNSCKYEDGTHSATVGYNNPETGYSQTYTLDVEIKDCQVVQINFPNDGYLDEDHISSADIDESGNTSIDGEDGKTYEIQID